MTKQLNNKMKSKVLLVFIISILSFNVVLAQEEKGFSTSADVIIGYSEKTFSTILGYDFGYKFMPDLYIGAGPMVGGSFGSGQSSFAAGAYAKVRYDIPIRFSVKPFVDGRVGYNYNISNEAGGMIYGFGLGVGIAKNIKVGLYCFVGTKQETETYTYYKTHTSPYTGKVFTTKHTGTKTVDKANFIPALLFSVDF
ncbi:MAG: hypothetical protein IJE73_05515 [Muribaculaceae bacterium]|nr:hypothetical protein [Muribaculaceae bacterium]